MSIEFKQEVEDMCNLSGYVEEKGRAEGRAEGELNIMVLYNWLRENERDTEAEAVMKPENEELRSALYKEYDEVKNNKVK